jgi:hypothetical protein
MANRPLPMPTASADFRNARRLGPRVEVSESPGSDRPRDVNLFQLPSFPGPEGHGRFIPRGADAETLQVGLRLSTKHAEVVQCTGAAHRQTRPALVLGRSLSHRSVGTSGTAKHLRIRHRRRTIGSDCRRAARSRPALDSNAQRFSFVSGPMAGPTTRRLIVSGSLGCEKRGYLALGLLRGVATEWS